MTTLPAVDPALSAALRLALALLLLGAARHKLADPRAFRVALEGYRVLPRRWGGVAAAGLLAAELALSFGLLLPATSAGAALGAACLLTLYAAAIALNLARGRRAIDCGCAGAGAMRPLSGALVVRNALLAAAALLAACPQALRPLLWLDALTVGGGAVGLGLLYAAIDASLANAPRLREIGRREWSTR